MRDGVVCCPGERLREPNGTPVVLRPRHSPCTLPPEVTTGLLWWWQMCMLCLCLRLTRCTGSLELELSGEHGVAVAGLAAVLPSPVPCVSTDGFDSQVP